MTDIQQKIIHIDMDAFFASVEQRDTPELRDIPIAIGGQPDARGVVATASYEARQFGIHSAMPMATAVRRCPQLVIVPPRIAYYREIALDIRDIFARFTGQIEPLSIDEAYLDVSHNDDFQGSATLLAEHILETIQAEIGLGASAGVSYCKFLAKYASTVNKPRGVYTITPDMAGGIIDALPIEKFHGIGPATQKRLNELNIFTGKDLRQADCAELQQSIGKSALFYHQLAHGIDTRPIQVERVRKSLGNETTFVSNISGIHALWHELQILVKQCWDSLSRQNLCAHTMTIKVKYADFSVSTKRHTDSSPLISYTGACIVASALLEQFSDERSVRLLGVSFSRLTPALGTPRQLRLFD